MAARSKAGRGAARRTCRFSGTCCELNIDGGLYAPGPGLWFFFFVFWPSASPRDTFEVKLDSPTGGSSSSNGCSPIVSIGLA